MQLLLVKTVLENAHRFTLARCSFWYPSLMIHRSREGVIDQTSSLSQLVVSLMSVMVT